MKDFSEVELFIGSGEDHFTMKRGSFRYKRKLYQKRKLLQTSKEESKEGTRLTYKDPRGTGEYILQFTDCQSDAKGVHRYEAELLEPVPEEINRFWVSVPAEADEKIYGCGETYSKLNLKGEKVRIWVAEHQNAGRITKKIIREKLTGVHPKHVLPFSKYESYYVQPTFVSSQRYFMHADTNAYSEFDFRKPDKTTLYTEERPHFYMESADSFPALSKKLADRLGHPTTLPDWLYDGVILAVQTGTDCIEEKIEKAEAQGTQIAGIWSQDWCGCRKTGFGYQVMWNWQWDEKLYPHLDTKIQQWKEKGIRFLGYINPFMAIEMPLYKEASEKGYCVKDKEGKDYLVTITTFPAAMIDFTNPDAYEWYKNRIIKENMIQLGMGGWMADFGEYLPLDAVLYSKEDPAILHNQWPAIWAKMNREAICESQKEDEVFFFTRAGFTKTISQSMMMWTGDQHVDWSEDDGMPSAITAMLSLSMSGYGISHSDAGGYTTIMHMRRSRELLMRWEEMNVFSPLFRTHEGNQPQNNVQFDDDDILSLHMARCSRMHAGLKEYLKEAVSENIAQGIPVIRPVFYHYDEPEAYLINDEYLLGRDVLVCPVLTEKAETRNVYLPEDTWTELFTGKEYTGGKYTVKAPIGRPPVFIRKQGKRYEELMDIAEK